MKERLQKYLARAGLGSRRRCEEFIKEGFVKVNGKVVTEMGAQIEVNKDKVYFKGKSVVVGKKYIYYKMNKPKDYITTNSDPKNRKTVYDILPKTGNRLFALGRLDRNTTGLLIFTNDGDLANKLMHPKKKIVKTYRVTVPGRLTQKSLETLEKGVLLDDGLTRPAKVMVESLKKEESVFLLSISEGRNRQIRRMCKALGYEVKALKRLVVGPIELGRLKVGQVKELTLKEIGMLKSCVS